MRTALVVTLLLAQTLAGQSVKNVLVLQTESPHYPATIVSAKAIHEVLGVDPHIQLFEEYMEESRLGISDDVLRRTLETRYADKNIDLLLTIGQPPFRFILQRGAELWPRTPKVFASVDTRYVPSVLPANVTGVASRLRIGATLDLALHLQPHLRHVFYITGNSPADLMRGRLAEDELKIYESRLEVTYLRNVTLAELLDRLAQLPDESAVLFGGMEKDAGGQAYVPARICSAITAASTAPVYAMHQTLLGCGIVGGLLFDIEGNARQAAEMGRRILQGDPIANLPVEAGPYGKLAVDWRQLKRWGLSETKLPPGTLVMYREPRPWERYWKYVLICSLVIFVEALLGALLFIQMFRRRESDEKVKRLSRQLIHAAEEERHHIARELYDDIGQRLSLVSMQIGSFLFHPGSATDGELSDLLASHQELDGIITDVHDLSHRLHSTKLQHLGLKMALQDLCNAVSRQHGIQVRLRAQDIPRYLPSDVALCLYRIAQEALSNVMKHSDSVSADVISSMEDGHLRLIVRDFGVGFDPLAETAGLGLATMHERLGMVGGELTVQSRPGKGTDVIATIPVPRQIAKADQASAA